MKVSGNIALVVGQQSYNLVFSPPFPAGVSPTGVFANVVMPGSDAEVLAVSVDLSSLTNTGVTVWLAAPPTSDSDGGYINWTATDAPRNMVTPEGLLLGRIALVAGQQSYQVSFTPPFAAAPNGMFPTVQMPNDSGDVLAASYSDITAYGCTVWLSGVPTSASAGGFIAWMAQGAPAAAVAPSAQLTGSKRIVAGQQSYAVVFSPPFAAPPASFVPSVKMPGSSGEVFSASFTNLTATGCVVWLSGEPTVASDGAELTWIASGIQTRISTSGQMTVAQLFHRLGRRARGGDFTKLSLTEKTDILEAANAGLQRLYNLLPVYFQEVTQGFVLPGPMSITTRVVTHSKYVSNDTFTRDQIGRTVNLDGDQGWNQIVGPNELLNPYMGESGIVNGTVYGNAIFSEEFPLERIIGNPQLANQNYAPINPVQMIRGYGQAAWLYQQQIGLPSTWWVQTFGNSQGHEPFVILRFAPAPNQAYAFNIRMAYWPKRLTLEDYQNAARVVVPQQFLEVGLIPLCLRELLSTPVWNSTPNDKDVIQRAMDAENYLRNQPAQVGAPNNRAYTPIGF